MGELKYKPVMMQDAIRDRFSELEDAINSTEKAILTQMRLRERLDKRHRWRSAYRRREQ